MNRPVTAVYDRQMIPNIRQSACYHHPQSTGVSQIQDNVTCCTVDCCLLFIPRSIRHLSHSSSSVSSLSGLILLHIKRFHWNKQTSKQQSTQICAVTISVYFWMCTLLPLVVTGGIASIIIIVLTCRSSGGVFLLYPQGAVMSSAQPDAPEWGWEDPALKY